MRQKLHRVRREAKKIMGRICCERMAVLSGFCCDIEPFSKSPLPTPEASSLGVRPAHVREDEKLTDQHRLRYLLPCDSPLR